ncbi:MAG TPA: FtsX-like permease family protein [Tepidisphaeraceae bacterium]|jgi:putative ABC transport system permease protein|nr:FtsX-like permease family protein [Tepidisphaeraceae bacterium]
MALLKLTISNLTTRKTRVALTVLAIAFSVSLVVGVTTGYKSIEAAAFKFLNTYLGSIDAQITFAGQGAGHISESLLPQIHQDSVVKSAIGRLETEINLIPMHRSQVKGIRRPEDRDVEKLNLESGQWFDTSSGNVTVIDQVLAEILKVKVGDTFNLPGVTSHLSLKVVGIIHKPEFLARQMQTAYVPLETLQRFMSPTDPHQLTRIIISFYPGTDADAFAKRWTPKLEAINPQYKLSLSKDRRQDMAKKLEGLSALSTMGGAVSMLAATFIVFSTLSMGVTERQRTLAMLRAIGAYRSQLGWLVIFEGILLAVIGVAVGVPLGLLWVKILAIKYKALFSAGVSPSWNGILFGAAGSLLAALIASFIPAWQAMRTSALEAMSPLASPGVTGIPWRSALVGLLLTAVDPFILDGPTDFLLRAFNVDPHIIWVRSFQFYAHFAIGLPAMMTGFFLLAPIFVWTLDRALSPLIAVLLGLRLALVRQQLSTAVWRAAGTCAALMVGLSVLVAMQTQGHSMIEGWQLPTRFPDLFIVSPFKPLNDEEIAKVAKVSGIRPGQFMPMAVISPGLGNGFFALAGAALVPDSTMFFGVDPDKAFDMMQLDFLEGNPNDAKALLKKGHHLIVTEEFRELKGLHLGGHLTLASPHGPIDYTIAGVVTSPGLDVMVGLYDLGQQFDQRTAASVFGTYADARRDFDIQGAEFFVANLDIGVQREALLKRVKEAVGKFGMAAYDVRQIKYKITTGLHDLLLLVTVIPLAALGIASLGVTNTILASIRTRSWQFGILRSIGVTRSQLLRLVTAEAILLGLVGVALGLVAGALLTIDARGLSAATLGYNPPLRIPWLMINIGIAAVLLVAFLASLLPSIGVSRRSPLSLLQAGRAAS